MQLSLARFGNLVHNSSPASVLQWENGNARPPKAKLNTIAEIFGISLEDLNNTFITDYEFSLLKELILNGKSKVFLKVGLRVIHSCISFFI